MICINNGMAKFKGFSTTNRNKPPFTLTDNELVKRDLLNEFYTKKGERVMRPNYGSVIWDLLMDPLIASTEEIIREDIVRIVGRDPRVKLIDIRIYDLDHTLRADVTLNYVEINETDVLYLSYDKRNSEGIN